MSVTCPVYTNVNDEDAFFGIGFKRTCISSESFGGREREPKTWRRFHIMAGNFPVIVRHELKILLPYFVWCMRVCACVHMWECACASSSSSSSFFFLLFFLAGAHHSIKAKQNIKTLKSYQTKIPTTARDTLTEEFLPLPAPLALR